MTNDIAPVPGLPGYYASRDGEVYSDRRSWTRLAPHTVNDHRRVTLAATQDGRRPHAWVHRMVLLAHVGPPPTPQHITRHLNGDPTDNRVENLAWGTHLENAQDALRHGTTSCFRKGERALRARITDAQAVEVERRARAGEADIALAEEFGISARSVYGIRKHETWRHLWDDQ